MARRKQDWGHIQTNAPGEQSGQAIMETISVTFHQFAMGDVDDVDIYVAQPIYEWQQTDKGRWVMKHAQDLRYYTMPDMSYFGHKIAIRGKLDPKLATEYFLRWR